MTAVLHLFSARILSYWRQAAAGPRPIFRRLRRISAPVMAMPMALRGGICRCRTWSSSSFHPTGIYGAGCLITEGGARRRAAI